MKKLLTLLLSVLAFASLTMPASAAFFMNAENLVVSEDLSDDAYMFGGNVIMEANVDGDLYLFGGTVSVNGDVAEDLVVAGGEVYLNGNVGGDVRVAGGNVRIGGSVADDVVVAGGKVDILSDADIAGSLITGSGFIVVSGNIGEGIQGGVGQMVLSGTVDGDVKLAVQERMDITESAQIGGNLEYSALLKSNVPEGVVAGEVVFNEFEKDHSVEKAGEAAVVWRVLSFVSSLLILLLFVIFAPNMMTKTVKIGKEHFFKSMAWGILFMVIAILGSIILMATVIGIPLALMALAMILVVFYLAKFFVASMLAGWMFKFKKNEKRSKLFFGTALVLLGYYLLGFIPVIGWLVAAGLFLVGVGIWMQLELDYFRFLRGKGEL